MEKIMTKGLFQKFKVGLTHKNQHYYSTGEKDISFQ